MLKAGKGRAGAGPEQTAWCGRWPKSQPEVLLRFSTHEVGRGVALGAEMESL